MRNPLKSASHWALIAAVLLGAPAFAQQDTGKVLPPPSLYDETTGAPATEPVPVRPAQPISPPVAAPSPRPTTTAVEPMPAPATTAAEPMPAPVQAEAKEPWYRSFWPFNRNQQPAAQPVAPRPAPAPAATAPAGRGATGAEFVYDTPNRTLRTGLLGKCVKTGMWGGETEGADCPGTTPVREPAAVAAIAPAPTPAPRPTQPEPVEVQPLMPEPAQEPKALETEPPPVVSTPQPAPMPAPAPTRQTTTLSADTLFAVNSYQLRPAAKSKLDEFAAQLDQFRYDTIRIIGHTDPTGAAALNERLSLARAEAVKRYLVSRGVPGDKILTEGMGSSMPMVTDKDCYKLPRSQRAACYQPDRRVEIEVSGVKVSKR